MKNFKVHCQSRWGEKIMCGQANDFEQAARLAIAILTERGWPDVSVISVEILPDFDFYAKKDGGLIRERG